MDNVDLIIIFGAPLHQDDRNQLFELYTTPDTDGEFLFLSSNWQGASLREYSDQRLIGLLRHAERFIVVVDTQLDYAYLLKHFLPQVWGDLGVKFDLSDPGLLRQGRYFAIADRVAAMAIA